MLDKLLIAENVVLGLRDFFLGNRMMEMANIDPKESNASLKIWIDPAGKCRKAGHNGARVKIEFNGKRLPIEIDDKAKIYVGKEPDNSQYKRAKDFVRKHYKAFLLHFRREWTDGQLLQYATLVGRKRMSIESALQYMIEDGSLEEIPAIYKED